MTSSTLSGAEASRDGIPLVPVRQVSGTILKVLGQVEADWYTSSRESYLEQTRFTETTDLRDLDRLLHFELMIFRWSQWLAAGEDYSGYEVDADQLRRNLKDASVSVNQLKDTMGLTKRARDDAASAGDFAVWLDNLRMRAKAFGVHREHQLSAALVLMNDLSAIVTAFDRSDAEERTKLGFETERDVLDWIRSTMLPEFHAVDAHFREHDQKYWIRSV